MSTRSKRNAPQRIGVVLAGGRGRRLGGRAKGAIAYRGRTLADRAAKVLQQLCYDVLISLREGDENPAPGRPTLIDPAPPGRGPLVGIDAAFDATHGSDLLVLACDYPFVEGELLRRLLALADEEADVTLMTDYAGRDHPLVALWRRSAAAEVRAAVAESRLKVRALFGELRVRRLAPNDFPGVDFDRVLRNVNEPGDLAALQGFEP